MPISNEKLKALLLEVELIPEAELNNLYEKSNKENSSFYDLIIKSGYLTDEQLGGLIADHLKTPFVNLSKVSIDIEILKIIPEVVARKQNIIAYGRDEKGLKVAINNPNNKEILELISKKTGDKINIYYATLKDIQGIFRFYKNDLQQTFDELLSEQVQIAGKNKSQEAPITKIFDLLMQYAYQNKTSDVHIEPGDEYTQVRFRIDGVLHDVLKFPSNLHDQLITRVKVLSKLRTDEHLSAQDSKMQMKMESEDLDIRVSIVPIVNGEKAVLRLLSSNTNQYSLTDLGLSEKDMNKVQKGFNSPYGMVLSTGPTGSGKTTSIYSILKILNSRDKNIATIEDPVEYEIQGINQIQVNNQTNLTFAEGLRSILRQDPNIIFVGEIRDPETADIAINSALTGHLVLSTVHTNDAATTLPRLTDMHIEPFLVASTVNVIIAQRLIRKICESCRLTESKTVENLEKQISSETIKKIFGDKQEIRLYRGKGCPVCHNTGYTGRIGLFEVLEVTKEIKDLIIAKADSDAIKKQAVADGMTTMLEDGLHKVSLGITTLEEVLRVTK